MCLYEEKGSKEAFSAISTQLESFISAKSGPGGLMWSHGATTNTAWIQCCSWTYFLSLELPAQTALFHLEIHRPQCTTIFVMIVQLQLPERNFTKYSSKFFCILVLLSIFKSEIVFFTFILKEKPFNAIKAILLCNNGCLGHTALLFWGFF